MPIGRPIDNLRCHVLDAGVAAGASARSASCSSAVPALLAAIWIAAGLTAERFVDIRSDPENACIAPVTRRRYRHDGTIEYRRPRADGQVKINGLRIELGEVEAALADCLGVRQCAVVVARTRRAHGGWLPTSSAKPWISTPRRSLSSWHHGCRRPWCPARWSHWRRCRCRRTARSIDARFRRPVDERTPGRRAPHGDAGEPDPPSAGTARCRCRGRSRQLLRARWSFAARHAADDARAQRVRRRGAARWIFEVPTIAALADRIDAAAPQGSPSGETPIARRDLDSDASHARAAGAVVHRPVARAQRAVRDHDGPAPVGPAAAAVVADCARLRW